MRVLGTVAILLVSGCLFAAPNQPQETAKSSAQEVQPPQAFITSDRVVYRAGEPIDLTFSIATPKSGSIVPGLRIENKDGEAVAPLAGRSISNATAKSIDGKQRSGAIPASEEDTAWTERVVDLRQWFDLDAIGLYSIVFEGQWIDEKGKAHPVESNVIHVQLAGAAGEFEPGGEPVEPRVIPLAEIWALKMPGTKPMEIAVGAAPDGDRDVAPEGTMVREILRAINKHEYPRRNAPPGFAVGGTGMAALREAHAVLVHGQPRRTEFRAGEEISLVFFSRNYGRYIQLNRVEHLASTVQITYDLVTHETSEVTSHLALIPITTSMQDEIRVEIRPAIDWALHSLQEASTLIHSVQTVCQSYTLEIRP